MMPMPPRRAGRSKRSHSVLLECFVRVGRNLSLIVSCVRSFRRLPMSGVVLTRKVQLLVKPSVNVA